MSLDFDKISLYHKILRLMCKLHLTLNDLSLKYSVKIPNADRCDTWIVFLSRFDPTDNTDEDAERPSPSKGPPNV